MKSNTIPKAPNKPEPGPNQKPSTNQTNPREDNGVPIIPEISGISAQNSNSNPDISALDNIPLASIPPELIIPVNNMDPGSINFPGEQRVSDKKAFRVKEQDESWKKKKKGSKRNNMDSRTINVTSESRRRKKSKNVPLGVSNSFLEDFDMSGIFDPSQVQPQNPKDPQSANNAEDGSFKRNFSFKNPGVSNSKDLNTQSFLKKKNKHGHFTEVGQTPGDQNILPNNDTSINLGLPSIPHHHLVSFQKQHSFQKIPSLRADASLHFNRNHIPAGSQLDLFSNMETSFQKLNESGINELQTIQDKSELLPSNYVSFNNPVLENLNTSFKDYSNIHNHSFNLDKNMKRLDRMDNSFNMTLPKQGPVTFQKGLNDTLNQSGQFHFRQPSRNNLDNSVQVYMDAPKENFLNPVQQENEMDISELKEPEDPNTSFDHISENILSMLDPKVGGKRIQVESQNKSKKAGRAMMPPIKEKFFMDPEDRREAPQQVNAKLKRVENVKEEESSDNAVIKEVENLKNSDIIDYIVKNYSSQNINDVVNAKCAKYKKGKPDIYKIINSVISKNKRWKRILEIVQQELGKKDESSDNSDNHKSTFSITTEQRKDNKQIVNKININFNTEVKYEANPWKIAKYLRHKKKKKKRKRRRKARCMEEGLTKRKSFKKSLKNYSERFSSSNGSDSSDQIINCKRVKEDSKAHDDPRMMASFISENKHNAFDPNQLQIENFTIKDGPSEVDKSSQAIEEEVVMVVKNPNHPGQHLDQNEPVKKRKRGRPKGSKNSKNPSVVSKMKKDGKKKRGRRRKRSLKETMKNIILNDGESYGMQSDIDSRMGVRSRRSRRKKSNMCSDTNEGFVEMRGNTKTIYDILRLSFTEMKVKTKDHAKFLNSNCDDAKTLRVILKKKFEILEEVEVASLKMVKEKKRNEEINKFVVKRCMKFLMKKNRENTRYISNDSENNKNNNLFRNEDENTLKLEGEDRKNQGCVLDKDQIPKDLEQQMKSMSHISMTEANKQTNLPESKIIQSDFPDINDLNDKLVPDLSMKDYSLQRGVFGPAVQDLKHPRFEYRNPKFHDFDQKSKDDLNKEPKENNKMLAHSKLLSEHQFYQRYFDLASKQTNTPLAKYYLPNTKLANNANKENKGNKSAQSFKTINIKYIRLILHSRFFARSIRKFLEETFEFEYRETRLQKLKLLAKSIKDPKYIKSVKLPWTMHEIIEAKTTFLKLIDSTEVDIKKKQKNDEKPLSQLSQKTSSAKHRRKKEKKSPMRIPERRNTRSRTRSRKTSPINQEDNFQACFANNNKSNKFLGN
jgi:hypothetical protein